MPYGDNYYPNQDNFPVPSFPQPVEPPSVDPDGGSLLSVDLAAEWLPVIEGALSQLELPSTWKGTHDEIILALNRATTLKCLFGEAPDKMIATPYWDESSGDDTDDIVAALEQDWFGALEGVGFVDNLSGWVFTAFVAANFGVNSAIKFAIGLRKLRLFFRTADFGAIVKVLIDGETAATVDTYAPEAGLTSVDIILPAAGGALRAEAGDDLSTMIIYNTGEANPLATPVDGLYGMQVVKKRLWEGEIGNPHVRYDPDTNYTQTDYGDEGTFTDNLSADPRYNLDYLFPLRGGSDPRCDAAANIIDAMRNIINTIITVIDLFETITLVAELVSLVVPAIGEIIDVIPVGLDFVLELGRDAIDDAFTSDVYDALTCDIYCYLSPDGSITQAQLYQWVTDSFGKYDTVVFTLIVCIFDYFWDVVGTNNAGRSGTATFDCDTCDTCTWTHTFNLANSNMQQWQLFPPFTPAGGGLLSSDRARWYATTSAAPGINQQTYLGIAIRCTYSTSTVITGVRVTYTGNRSNGNFHKGRFLWVNDAGSGGASSTEQDWDTGTNLDWVRSSTSFAMDATHLNFALIFGNNPSPGTDSFYATEIQVSGTGFDPFPQLP